MERTELIILIIFIFVDKLDKMISEIIKYSGLFVIMIGIIILVVSFLNGITSNIGLISALLLIIIGFVTFLLINRFKED